MKKILLSILVFIGSITSILAQDDQEFSQVCSSGQTLKYQVLPDQKSVKLIGMECEPNHPSALTIPSTVTHDGVNYSVTVIGESACEMGESLTELIIPSSVVEIELWAFAGCSGLISIIVDKKNPVYDSRNNCNAIIETLSNTLVKGCGKTIIPNSVTSIGQGAFAGYENLTTINIPESVKTIGDYAFSRCYYLTSIKIPHSVISIGEGAFYKSGLTSIELPNSITAIKEATFVGCSFTTFTIPNSVNVIGSDAFERCRYLKTVNIPNSVTSIGEQAFDRCTQLTSINIPNSVTEIGDGAFCGCENLTSIFIPRSVIHIGDGICAGCMSLTSTTVDPKNPVYHSENNSIVETATKKVISSREYNIISGEWYLQEVQIPSSNSSYPLHHYSLHFFLDGINEYNNVNDDMPLFYDQWDHYQIYNDTVLTMSHGEPAYRWKTYLIKKLTQDELILADGYAINGMCIYKYGRHSNGEIKHTKHNYTTTIDHNPIVKRLSKEEITQNSTPAAVAYNTVMAIYNSDYASFLSNLSPEVKESIEEHIASNGYSFIDETFSESNERINIKGWKKKIDSGDYEIAVLYVQDEWFDQYGRVRKKVYIDCVPSDEIYHVGFLDITRDGITNVKLRVVDDNGTWKVIGFK